MIFFLKIQLHGNYLESGRLCLKQCASPCEYLQHSLPKKFQGGGDKGERAVSLVLPSTQVTRGLLGRWRGDLSELLISVGVYVPWRFQMKLPIMWERCINLWLRPPPWGECCHSHCCTPFAATSRASCCLLTEEPHCNVSLYPPQRLLPQEPKPSIISLVTYYRRYRMDERHREIKVILPLGAMYSKLWLTGKLFPQHWGHWEI